jgi:hypothetical protein
MLDQRTHSMKDALSSNEDADPRPHRCAAQADGGDAPGAPRIGIKGPFPIAYRLSEVTVRKERAQELENPLARGFFCGLVFNGNGLRL